MIEPYELPIELDPADEAIKVYSVKELPESQRVPALYDSQYVYRTHSDTQIVIRALRNDVKMLYSIIEKLAATINELHPVTPPEEP